LGMPGKRGWWWSEVKRAMALQLALSLFRTLV
jgi:hypothetical protein